VRALVYLRDTGRARVLQWAGLAVGGALALVTCMGLIFMLRTNGRRGQGSKVHAGYFGELIRMPTSWLRQMGLPRREGLSARYEASTVGLLKDIHSAPLIDFPKRLVPDSSRALEMATQLSRTARPPR
jgi:hypothetical protein